MKNICNNCSRNMDGVCEVYQIVLDENITSCPMYDILVGEYSIEERLEYDMGFVEEE